MTEARYYYKLARGMTVQSDNGKHYAFCVRCRWESPRQGYTVARRIARQPCPVCHPEKTVNLTFTEVSTINAKRADRWHHGFPNEVDGWTGADWSNAMQGEAGEAGNVVKKLRRIETSIRQAEQGQERDEAYEAMLKQKLATEIGDTFLYLDLLAQFYGLDLQRCVVDTFNRVSIREGFPERIDY